MKTILFVDDEQAVRKLYTALSDIELVDIEAISCESGYAAIELISASEKVPSLVVTDFRMADGDGGMLSHFCNDKNIPCVIVTCYEASDISPYVPKTTQIVSKIDLFSSSNFFKFFHKALQ